MAKRGTLNASSLDAIYTLTIANISCDNPPIDMDLHDPATDQRGDLRQFVLVGLNGREKLTMRKHLSLCHRHKLQLHPR